MTKQIQHTTDQIQAMRHDYEDGMPLEFVGKKYCIAWMTARNRIIKAGGTIRPKNTPVCNVDELIKDWQSTMTVEEIAQKHMYEGPHSVYALVCRLRKQGVQIPPRYKVKRNIDMIRNDWNVGHSTKRIARVYRFASVDAVHQFVRQHRDTGFARRRLTQSEEITAGCIAQGGAR